jgi:CheY-like chemotaxis protein
MMTIVTAESGSVALEILDQRADIAIILMDIMMPVMNGYETMSAIRQRPQATELPIIAVTGKAAGGERQRCIAAGATDYVSMPIDTAVLLTAISDCLLATSSRDAQSAASAPCEPQPTAIASVPADTAHTTPFPFPFPDSLKRYATSSNPLRNRRALNRSSTAIGSTSLTDQPSGPSPAP